MVLVTNDAGRDLDRYLVDTVSYEVSRRFRDVQLVDIRENLWGWYDTHPNYHESLRTLDPVEYERLVRRALKQQALRFCHDRRAERVGYHVDDLTFYSTGLLRELLPAVVAGVVISPSREEQRRNVSAPNEGQNLEAMVVDVKRAIEALDPGRRLRLILHYQGYEDMGERELGRTLALMQQFLGGPAPTPDPGDLEPEAEVELDSSKVLRLIREGRLDLL